MDRSNNILKNSEEIKKTRKWIKDHFFEQFKYLETVLETMEDEEVDEFREYMRYFLRNHNSKDLAPDVDLDKLKAFMLLFSNLSEKGDAAKVVSYFESQEYGWHKDEFYLNNPCLRRYLNSPDSCCKRKDNISDAKIAQEILGDLCEIFQDKKTGQFMLYVFSYCLVALFSSRLNKEGFSVPFLLQIACDKSSLLYQFVEEVLEICNVNSGLFGHCTRLKAFDGYCGYKHQIYYPTQATVQDMDVLCHNRDVPVLISGYENERYYQSLLRQIANVPCKNRALDWKDRFNFLPVFVCPEIKTTFDNVLSIDLTEVEISKTQLSLLRKRKQVLASWSVALVMEADRYLFHYDYEDQIPGKKARHLLAGYIGEYANYVSQRYPFLTLNNAQNVALLNFIMRGYLTVFQKSCSFPAETEFACFENNGEPLYRTCEENVDMLTNNFQSMLANLHKRYLPAPRSVSAKNRAALSLAKQIEKHYRALKVAIRITPLEVKADRYIFIVDTLESTKVADISKNAETVQHRLKRYECFRVDLRDLTAIKLVVAEKQLTDNSLLEMLHHEDFSDNEKKLPFALGFDEVGDMRIEDLDTHRHLLLGGTTGSGKSTAISSLLMSLAYKHRTGDVNVLIVDLLGRHESDFSIFENQPFLAAPIITEPIVAAQALQSLYQEKKRRLSMEKTDFKKLPHIVCVIDEFPSLFSDIPNKEYEKRVKAIISDLISRGRHAKIHMVLAMQNPVKEYIAGCGVDIISARIAFRCAHYKNSVAIIGRAGAEKLIGQGQMIFDSILGKDQRLLGSFMPEKEMKTLLAEVKKDFKQQNEYPFRIGNLGGQILSLEDSTHFDEKLAEVIVWALPQKRVANSRIQAEFKVANGRANRLLSKMEEWKLIRKLHGNLGWELLPSCYEDLSAEVTECLLQSGKTEEEINKLFSNREDTRTEKYD